MDIEVKEQELSTQERFKRIITNYGSMKVLSDKWGIPYRTIQNWSGGQREMPLWQIEQFEYLSDHNYKK